MLLLSFKTQLIIVSRSCYPNDEQCSLLAGFYTCPAAEPVRHTQLSLANQPFFAGRPWTSPTFFAGRLVAWWELCPWLVGQAGLFASPQPQ